MNEQKLREALDLLEKCAPSHFDFSGALVHHTDEKQTELRFDPCCPKCVIPKAIALLEAILADSGESLSAVLERQPPSPERSRALEEAICGKPVEHLIAGASWFACVLKPGHEGPCERGGDCFKHGKYMGSQCPEWPNCISAVASAGEPQVKGVCEYCKKPVEVRVNEAWHSKGDKVWHEVCSYQEQIQQLTERLAGQEGSEKR